MPVPETPRLADLKVAPDGHLLSLAKLAGSPIVDVHGYISTEFGDPVFKACEVVFADGTGLSFEGEHDIAYLVASYRHPSAPRVNDEVLQALDEAEG